MKLQSAYESIRAHSLTHAILPNRRKKFKEKVQLNSEDEVISGAKIQINPFTSPKDHLRAVTYVTSKMLQFKDFKKAVFNIIISRPQKFGQS